MYVYFENGIAQGMCDHPPGYKEHELKEAGYYQVQWTEPPAYDPETHTATYAPFVTWPIKDDMMVLQWEIHPLDDDALQSMAYQKKLEFREDARVRWIESASHIAPDVWEDMPQTEKDQWKTYRKTLKHIIDLEVEDVDLSVSLLAPGETDAN